MLQFMQPVYFVANFRFKIFDHQWSFWHPPACPFCIRQPDLWCPKGFLTELNVARGVKNDGEVNAQHKAVNSGPLPYIAESL